jgi:hypothetical protein
MSAGLYARHEPEPERKVTEMKKGDVFPSRFFKAEDVETPLTLVVASTDYEPLRDHNGEMQQKLIVSFKKTRKRLVVNLTNFDNFVSVTGEPDSDSWAGATVQLYATTVQVGPKTVACVRVRDADQANLKPAKATATKRPVKQASADDDMDDSIPFN